MASLEDLNVDALDALGDQPQQDIDTMFVLISGFMVFFMHSGFAMLSVGSVQAKNAKNILLLILLDACFGCLAFYLVGFALAYGGTYGDPTKGNRLIGWGGFALIGLPRSDWYMWFFQYAFAATAATIVSGAVAERTRFITYIAYVIFLSAWVYPVLAHWTWSADGWASPSLPAASRLFKVGLIDFAGCAPVHMVGGISALAGAYFVGPRVDPYRRYGTVEDIEGHNVQVEDIEGHNASFVILGVFILWFGWYGFNPGSALAILGNGEIAALAAVNTTISAATGTLSALVCLMVKDYYMAPKGEDVIWDLLGAANGTLAGLVAITAGCVVVQANTGSALQPWAAFIIGISGGFVYVIASFIVSNVLYIDDPLDAGAVHGFCGAWGLIMAGAFAHGPFVEQVYGAETAAAGFGFLMPGGGFRVIGAALVGLLATLAWTLANMVPFFYVLNYVGVMRVQDVDEDEGLDIAFHGGPAYDHNEEYDTRQTVVQLCKQMEILADQQYQLKEIVERKVGGTGGRSSAPGTTRLGNASPRRGGSPKRFDNPAFEASAGQR